MATSTKKATKQPTKSSTSETSDDTTSKQTTAKKTTAKKSTARKSPESSESDQGSGSRRSSAPKAQTRPPARATVVAATAARELLELTGKQAEGVTGLEKTEDGWTVQVEVVEVRRIPDTTDVLALYEVQTDTQGSLLGYRRIRRYARGVPGND